MSKAEVPRILVKQHRKNRISPEITIKGVSKRRTITLRVPRKTLPIFRERIFSLLNKRS